MGLAGHQGHYCPGTGHTSLLLCSRSDSKAVLSLGTQQAVFCNRRQQAASSTRGGFTSPRTPPNRRAASCSPPLVVVAGLTFVGDTPRQFPGLALTGRPRELPRWSPSSLAGSRRADSKLSYCRSSSLRSPVSPLQGGPESLLLFSLTGRDLVPPRPSLNRSGGKAAFSPLGVLAGLTFASSFARCSSPVSPPKGGGQEIFAHFSPRSLAGSRWVGVTRLFLVPVLTPLACLPVVVSPRPCRAAETAPPLAAARLVADVTSRHVNNNIILYSVRFRGAA